MALEAIYNISIEDLLADGKERFGINCSFAICINGEDSVTECIGATFTDGTK